MFSNGTCLLTAGSAHETVICYCKAFNGVYLSTKDSGRHQDTEGAVSNLSFIALPTPHLCLSWEGLQKCFHHLWHVCGFSVLHICRDVLKPLIFMWSGLPVRLGETLGKDSFSLTNMFNFFFLSFFLLLNFVFTPPLPYSCVFTLSKMDGLEQFQHFTSISLENKIAIICRCWKRLCVCDESNEMRRSYDFM